MLSAEHRLRKEKDFERVFKKGKKIKGDSLYLKFAPNKLPESRFGFVVSKKVSLKATERNKIKRKLSEAVKDLLPFLKKGFDVVLLVAPSFDSFQSLQEMLGDLFKKAGLMQEK